MGFKFVLLWTDAALWLLMLALVGYAIRVARQEHLRVTWEKVLRDPAALCSAVVLVLFLGVNGAVHAGPDELSRHIATPADRAGDGIQVELLEELRDDIGLEAHHLFGPGRRLRVLGRGRRLDEAGLFQLDDRALDPLAVEAGQPRAEPRYGQATVQQDQDQPLALRELVRLLIDLAQPSIGAAIDHR